MPQRKALLGLTTATRNSFSLAEAIDRNWLRLFYQPKFALPTRAVCGAEALLRIAHPEHGLLLPAAFLPPAADPLHQPLTEFVLRQVSSDWLRFVEAGHRLRLSINIPVTLLCAPGFIALVRKTLPRHPWFPGLILEVTEDEAMRDADMLKEIGAQLKCFDVFLSVDDFGAAYATSSRLLDLPFSEVKLDGSFVSGCAADSIKAMLCQAVIEIAHRFGAVVCAEGVEKDEDAAILASIGCDLAQGYFFGEPMPAEELLTRFGRTRPGFSGRLPLFQHQPELAVSA